MNVAQGRPGPSRLRDTFDEDADGHVRTTLSDASLAIKNLDRLAFPLVSNEGEEQRPKKIVRVADVDAMQAAQSPSHFSRLSGLGSLHRERARRRRTTPYSGIASTVRLQKELVSKTYRPLSLDQLLQRLTTFTISTYSNKPKSKPRLAPLGMAMGGWKHASGLQRDEVKCATCSAQWHVTPDTAESSVKDEHDPWCPWRIRSCHASLYRVPIRSAMETQLELTSTAEKLAQCSDIETVDIECPEGLDVENLRTIFHEVHPSAIILSILGWQIEPQDQVSRSVRDTIVSCRMCARRAGLWAYVKGNTPQRTFEPAQEHKDYCPMVNALVQSGRWLETGNTTTTQVVEIHPAWQLKLRLLHAKQSSRIDSNQSLKETDVRKLRSHEIIGAVKDLLNGRMT